MRPLIPSIVLILAFGGAYALGRASTAPVATAKEAERAKPATTTDSRTAATNTLRSEPVLRARPASANVSPSASRNASPGSRDDIPTAPSASETAAVLVRVSEGSILPVRIETTASSETSAVGDQLVARLVRDVTVSGGTLPAGTEVRGRVIAADAAKRFRGEARLAVVFDSLVHDGRVVKIVTGGIDSSAASTKSKDKKIVAGSAAAGLILGAIKDGKKGAVIGAVAGGAAGMGAVMVMKGDDVVLPRGATLDLKVERATTLDARS